MGARRGIRHRRFLRDNARHRACARGTALQFAGRQAAAHRRAEQGAALSRLVLMLSALCAAMRADHDVMTPACSRKLMTDELRVLHHVHVKQSKMQQHVACCVSSRLLFQLCVCAKTLARALQAAGVVAA